MPLPPPGVTPDGVVPAHCTPASAGDGGQEGEVGHVPESILWGSDLGVRIPLPEEVFPSGCASVASPPASDEVLAGLLARQPGGLPYWSKLDASPTVTLSYIVPLVPIVLSCHPLVHWCLCPSGGHAHLCGARPSYPSKCWGRWAGGRVLS